jgi:hypothetical protein
VDGQIGLEETPEAYTERMTEVFSAVNDVLRSDGTLWLNLGDSYAANGQRSNSNGEGKSTMGWPNQKQETLNKAANMKLPPVKHGLKSKDLVGIPWRVAFALQADGWYLRSDIIEEVEFYCPCGCGHVLEERIIRYAQDRDMIWKKPNPMPESVTDRPTKAHEYLFLMAKSERYYYDHEAVKEPQEEYERNRRLKEQAKGLNSIYDIAADGKTGQQRLGSTSAIKNVNARHALAQKGTRNRRSVWTVATKPYPGAHFAVFPPELIEPCILAGTKEGDIVLDPFSGSGTVGQVCKKHRRRYIGIELNEEYLKLSPDRIGRQGVLL